MSLRRNGSVGVLAGKDSMTELDVRPPGSVLRRILIVEDEPLIAYSLYEGVTSMGFECVGPYADLATALQKATFETFDAAILNLMIKGGWSYSVGAVLASRGIPFAFASGLPHNEIEPEWKDRPYIEKPYSSDDIKVIFQVLIPHHVWGTMPLSPTSEPISL